MSTDMSDLPEPGFDDTATVRLIESKACALAVKLLDAMGREVDIVTFDSERLFSLSHALQAISEFVPAVEDDYSPTPPPPPSGLVRQEWRQGEVQFVRPQSQLWLNRFFRWVGDGQ
jgi:hypothetical protein